MAKLSTLQLLRLFKKARELSDVPDIHDEAACRQWLRELVAVLKDVVPSTETPVDDEAVNLLGLIATSDTAWAHVYKVLFLIVTSEPFPLSDRETDARLTAVEASCDARVVAETVETLSELFTP